MEVLLQLLDYLNENLNSNLDKSCIQVFEEKDSPLVATMCLPQQTISNMPITVTICLNDKNTLCCYFSKNIITRDLITKYKLCNHINTKYLGISAYLDLENAIVCLRSTMHNDYDLSKLVDTLTYMCLIVKTEFPQIL